MVAEQVRFAVRWSVSRQTVWDGSVDAAQRSSSPPTHQVGYLVTATDYILSFQLGIYARAAIRPLAAFKDTLNRLMPFSIPAFLNAGFPASTPAIIPTARHAQRLAHHLVSQTPLHAP
jgi:hypothetical protein